ncbi:Kinesin-like protein kip2, partial [Tulasnella sp. 403]
FASRVKKVHLNATKKEIVDTDALIERYRKEILDLKARLAEREKGKVEPTAKRRLSAREQEDENRAMDDLNSRIKQLTNLILTSQTVEEARGDESRPVSPCKLDFDLSPFQLQEQLLSAKRTIDSQANQILSLEAALSARPLLPSDAPETEKDRLIDDLRKTVRELEIVTSGYEDNLGAPLRAVKEDVEREWKPRVEELEETVKDKVSYIEELERALEREKQMRFKSEREKVALVGFVREIDLHMSHKSSLTLSSPSLSPLAEGQSNVQLQKSPNAALDIPPKLSSLLEEDEVEFLIAD